MALLNNFKKILLINFGGIGDEILFLPVIDALKKQYPEAEITLCLEKRSSAFIFLTDLIDNYFCINIKSKNKYFELLKLYFRALFGGYDLVISSGSNPLIPLLLFFTGIKTRAGYASKSFTGRLLTHPAVLNKNQYAGLMYYDLVKSFTDKPFEPPEIKINETDKEQNSVLVHPGASAAARKKNIIKTLSADIWAQIIIKLLKKGKKVYLAGGPDDYECIKEIRQLLKNEDLTNFSDMYGKTENIIDLAALIKRVELLLCADSAPMHIGAAVKTKTAAIFGPTNEKLLILEDGICTAITNNAPCRPCLWHKRQTSCPPLDCLNFNADELADKVISLL